MGIVRTASIVDRPVEYANATVTAAGSSRNIIGILNDKATFLLNGGSGTTHTLYVSTDNGATSTIAKAFNDSTYRVDGAVETPNGELLVSVQKSSAVSEVWRSTGWVSTNPTAATWAKVWSSRSTSTGVLVRVRWGLNQNTIAPSWSKHSGAVFMSEYGPNSGGSGAPTDPQDAAIRVYMSTDDGITWRTIFNLVDYAASVWPTESRFHIHAVAYDPWFNRVLVSFGDGGNATTGHCGIVYSDNPEATAPTWTLVPSSSTSTSREQVTTMIATEAGISCLSDGQPNGIRLLPRRKGRTYGALIESVLTEGYNVGPIGSTLYRSGGLTSPHPGLPIFACMIESSSTGRLPGIFISYDGITWREFYRHGTATSGGAPGIERAFGPTVDGKIIASINLSGTSQVLAMDYIPKATQA